MAAPRHTHVLRYDCENDCNDCKTPPCYRHAKSFSRTTDASIAHLPSALPSKSVAPAGCQTAIIWTLAAMAMVVIAGSAQAQPHMPQPRETGAGAVAVSGLLGSRTGGRSGPTCRACRRSAS